MNAMDKISMSGANGPRDNVHSFPGAEEEDDNVVTHAGKDGIDQQYTDQNGYDDGEHDGVEEADLASDDADRAKKKKVMLAAYAFSAAVLCFGGYKLADNFGLLGVSRAPQVASVSPPIPQTSPLSASAPVIAAVDATPVAGDTSMNAAAIGASQNPGTASAQSAAPATTPAPTAAPAATLSPAAKSSALSSNAPPEIGGANLKYKQSATALAGGAAAVGKTNLSPAKADAPAGAAPGEIKTTVSVSSPATVTVKTRQPATGAAPADGLKDVSKIEAQIDRLSSQVAAIVQRLDAIEAGKSLAPRKSFAVMRHVAPVAAVAVVAKPVRTVETAAAPQVAARTTGVSRSDFNTYAVRDGQGWIKNKKDGEVLLVSGGSVLPDGSTVKSIDEEKGVIRTTGGDIRTTGSESK